MYDWTDYFLEHAKMSYPRLVPEFDSLATNGDMELAMELLLDQVGTYV